VRFYLSIANPIECFENIAAAEHSLPMQHNQKMVRYGGDVIILLFFLQYLAAA
jgi:hypothetical protein